MCQSASAALRDPCGGKIHTGTHNRYLLINNKLGNPGKSRKASKLS
jgi:hypothetical protein